MLELKTVLEGGERRNLKILIDTGGEINLIRTGLFPRRFSRPAQKAYDIFAVNGRILQGGKTTIDLKLCFTLEIDGEIQEDEIVYDATFWEAEIDVDAILFYFITGCWKIRWVFFHIIRLWP